MVFPPKTGHHLSILPPESVHFQGRTPLARLHILAKGSGGDFYLTLGARVSKRFARAMIVGTLEGRTAFTETFRMLGLKKMATFNALGRSLEAGIEWLAFWAPYKTLRRERARFALGAAA